MRGRRRRPRRFFDPPDDGSGKKIIQVEDGDEKQRLMIAMIDAKLREAFAGFKGRMSDEPGLVEEMGGAARRHLEQLLIGRGYKILSHEGGVIKYQVEMPEFIIVDGTACYPP